MNFEVRKKELEEALKAIKGSKALGNTKEEILTSILIKCEKNGVSFTVGDSGFWASSSIKSPNEAIKITEEGSAFVDGQVFIDIISQMPDDKFIQFELPNDNDKPNSFLGSKFDIKKGKDEFELGFVLRDPQHFEETPPEEKRTKVSVSTKALLEAISSVEFATSEDERKQGLWGCLVEVYTTKSGEKKISTMGTDKSRICWYEDEEDTHGKPDILFFPVKAGFLAALRVMDPGIDVEIESGNDVRYTILRQPGQWHAIPNVVSPEEMPDRKMIVEKIRKAQKASIKLEKSPMMTAINMAEKATGGKFGISIKLDIKEKEKKATFSINRIEAGSVTRVFVKRNLNIEEEDFSGDPISDTVILSIESLKDIITRYNGDKFTINMSNGTSPVEILSNDKNQKFKYITSVIQTLPDDESDEESDEKTNEDSE